MKRKRILLLRLFLLTFLNVAFVIAVYSQAGSGGVVSGKVVENTNKQPVESAAVKLLYAKDSASISGTTTNRAGDFTISNLPAGSYILKISFVGYKSLLLPLVINAQKLSVNIGTVTMENGIDLEAVSVIGEAIAIKVKRDTTEYNAESYKTMPNATTEELLKKLPGIEVEKDGSIKASGQTVTKVTVDGKEFFGANTKAATQNIPADAVSKVQVIDDKTDQAKASGIDRGDRDKVMNLVLKEDKKSGWFGGSSLAGGTQSRYVGSLSVNHFTKDNQFNIILGSNNVNQGFSSDDGANFLGGANTGNLPGVNKTFAGGINLSDAWGKKNTLKFSGSYIASVNSSEAEVLQDIQNTQATGVFYNSSSNVSSNNNQLHRFNVRLTSQIDSLTSLMFTPVLSFSSRKFLSNRDFSQKNSTQQKINDGITIANNNSFTPSFNGTLSLSRKLKKQKGTLSLSLSDSYNDVSSDNINQTTNNYYQNNSHQIFNRLENQDRLNNSFSITNSLSHIISKDKKTSGFVSATMNLNDNNSDRKTVEYNPVTGNYEKLVDSLTNDNQSGTNSYGLSFGINKASAKWIVNATYGLNYVTLQGNTTGKSQFERVMKNYTNPFLPYLFISYRPKATVAYTFLSYINVNTPQVSDLLLVQYNTDPLNVRQGNPGLRSYKQNFYNVNYSKSNPKRNTFFRLNMTYNLYQDFISSSRVFDPKTGIQYLKAVNVDGNYSISLGSEFTLPTKIKGLRIGSGFNTGNFRTVGLVDNVKNNTDRFSQGTSFNVSYAYKDQLNLTFNNRLSHVHVNNSTQPNINSDYFDLTNTIIFSIEPVKNWRINTDFSRQSAANQKVMLFNAGIQKFFMDKRQLSLEFKGFDLLNQNSDISRIINSNLVTDTRTNNIRQYFYFKLLYRINKLGSTASSPAATGR